MGALTLLKTGRSGIADYVGCETISWILGKDAETLGNRNLSLGASTEPFWITVLFDHKAVSRRIGLVCIRNSLGVVDERLVSDPIGTGTGSG